MAPRKTPNTGASEQWKPFLQQCLLHRVDAAEFKELSRLLFQRCPIGDSALVDTLLRTRLSTGVKWDPLFPLYVDCFCRMGRVRIATVLSGLLKYSSIHAKPSPGADVDTVKGKAKAQGKGKSPNQDKDRDRDRCYTLMTDIKVIQDAMLSVSTGATAKTLLEVLSAFSAVADWIQAIIAWHNSLLDADLPAGVMGLPDAVLLFESVGILLAALAGTGKGLQVLSAGGHEGLFVS